MSISSRAGRVNRAPREPFQSTRWQQEKAATQHEEVTRHEDGAMPPEELTQSPAAAARASGKSNGRLAGRSTTLRVASQERGAPSSALVPQASVLVQGGRVLPQGPLTLPKRRLAVKYALDRPLAGLLLVLLLPAVLCIAAVIKLSSPGPVLFRQRRVGRYGREFEMLKFRTMRVARDDEAEADADWASATLGLEHPATPAQDRRTTIGRLLRASYLDELPQLFNVMRGDMSLVGPRPERSHYVDRFSERFSSYANRHRVKPGMTGLAQLSGHRGATPLGPRIELDNVYIETWSLLLDVRILVHTLVAPFVAFLHYFKDCTNRVRGRSEGAYCARREQAQPKNAKRRGRAGIPWRARYKRD
jgi:lipopolysaccharide/colanic/teichoic acid biosynthesis glycosyltransferase